MKLGLFSRSKQQYLQVLKAFGEENDRGNVNDCSYFLIKYLSIYIKVGVGSTGSINIERPVRTIFDFLS